MRVLKLQDCEEPRYIFANDNDLIPEYSSNVKPSYEDGVDENYPHEPDYYRITFNGKSYILEYDAHVAVPNESKVLDVTTDWEHHYGVEGWDDLKEIVMFRTHDDLKIRCVKFFCNTNNSNRYVTGKIYFRYNLAFKESGYFSEPLHITEILKERI